jgi:hypothetical protein
MVGSPFPSHPTVRSVFPSTAVRQSASHTMRRFRHVFEPAAANGHESHGIQRAVWEACPPKTPALPSLGQIPAKADIDEALQPSECLAGGCVSAVVSPPRHDRMHPLHACRWVDRCPSRGKGVQPVAPRLLGGRGREQVDGVLAAPGALPFHEVETDAVESVGQSCHAGLVTVERQLHPRGNRLAGRQGRLRASAAHQDGVIGVAVQCGPQLRRVASPVPQVIEQVSGDITVPRRARGALRPPDGRCPYVPPVFAPNLARWLEQLQHTPIRNALRDHLSELPGRDAGAVGLAVDLHHAPGPVVQVFPQRHGGLLGGPLRPVAVGAVVQVRFNDRL